MITFQNVRFVNYATDDDALPGDVVYHGTHGLGRVLSLDEFPDMVMAQYVPVLFDRLTDDTGDYSGTLVPFNTLGVIRCVSSTVELIPPSAEGFTMDDDTEHVLLAQEGNANAPGTAQADADPELEAQVSAGVELSRALEHVAKTVAENESELRHSMNDAWETEEDITNRRAAVTDILNALDEWKASSERYLEMVGVTAAADGTKPE